MKTKNKIIQKTYAVPGGQYQTAKNVRQFYNKNTRAQRSDGGVKRKP